MGGLHQICYLNYVAPMLMLESLWSAFPVQAVIWGEGAELYLWHWHVETTLIAVISNR